ncbi:MAG: hypothetical protein J6K17_06505 [Oscillospiraceae bacterium]|nr:hypothetical protein [Oscillospiraceae bacterium]
MAKNNSRPAGIGTGYLSLMMIFVVLCLTILAALSFSAAESEKKYSEKSAEYTKAYYDADTRAKQTYAQIAETVNRYTDYSDFMLLGELDAIEGVSYESYSDRIDISWFTPINDRQSIYSEISISDNGTAVTGWYTIQGDIPEEEPLNVWLGE